jgi:CheY-like chemotaxis protein
MLREGAVFTIYLPAVASAPHNPAPLDIASTGVPGGTEGVLVVEDEAPLRDLVVNVLEIYGYHTFHADKGAAALKLWAEHKGEIDLLLTDMVMPEGMTGPQLAQRLTAENPKLKVIYTSGYSPGLLNKDVALMEGSNFLPKPYKPIRLAQMIRECLDKK